MRATLLFRRGQDHQYIVMKLLAEGLRQHGILATLMMDDADPIGDFVVTWGEKRKYDLPQLVLEAGYINGCSGDYVSNRLRFVSAGWNGMHGRADCSHPEHPPSDRWNALGIEVQPWRDIGEYVLICDQHPGDIAAPPEGWWQPVAEQFRERVIYRPHPIVANEDMRSLAEALEDAKYCVTWSSTAAVEAVIAGVPTWALDEGSIAYGVCRNEIAMYDAGEDAYRPDRTEWLHRLAYRQWRHSELESGEAWEYLKAGL